MDCHYCHKLVEKKQLSLICVTCKSRFHTPCYFNYHPNGSLMHIRYGCDNCKMDNKYKKIKDIPYNELPYTL